MKLQKYILAWVALSIALAVFAIPATAADLKTIQPNGIVLIGEKGLNITPAVGGQPYLAYWGPGHAMTSPPDRSINLTTLVLTNFNIDSRFVGTEGENGLWWQWNGTPGSSPTKIAFQVLPVTGDIRILNLDLNGKDISDGSAVIGSLLDFKIEDTTLQYIQNRSPLTPMDCDIVLVNPVGNTYTELFTPTGTNPLINQNVTTDPFYWSSKLGTIYWENQSWNTGERYPNITCNYYYPYGTYTVKIVCDQNLLDFNSVPHTVTLYEEQLDLTVNPSSLTRGQQFSTTITGVPNQLYLLWVKNCKPITGKECDQPPFILPQNQQDPELKIWYEEYRECDFGETPIQCTDCFGCLKRVKDTVPDMSPPEGAWYVLVETDENGQATVEWQTTVDTGIKNAGCEVDCWNFPIRVQRWEQGTCCEDGKDCPYAPWECEYDPNVIFDETTVEVCKGEFDMWTVVYNDVTDQAYLGETVCIRGINRDSCCVYLFIKGPCQSCPGNNLCCNHPVVNGDGSTFTSVQVDENGYWEYIWQTKLSPLDLGQYTIYAASKPNDGPSLECKPCTECDTTNKSCAAWDKQNFTFLEPTLTADIHPKVLRIVCCEPVPIMVSGTATGIVSDSLEYDHSICPGPGCPEVDQIVGFDQAESEAEFRPVPIAIWVFGENKVGGSKYIFHTALTDCPSGNFSIDISDWFNSLQLQPGEYKVVVQHPMYNHVLDVIPDTWLGNWYSTYSWWFMFWNPTYVGDPNKAFVISRVPVQWSKLFQIDGPGRLVGMDAYNALIVGLEDQNVDDKYVVLNFKVESNTAIRADFSGSPSSGGAPLTVEFTDISDGAPTSWLWSFGDGNTATEKNPTHTYIGPGSYSVTLSVSSAEGTSSITKNNYVTVTGVSPTVTPTPVPPSGSNINLYNGWNFVSTPKTLADGSNTAGVVFAGVNTGGHSIYLYNAGTGLWQSLSNSSPVIPLDGIWIYSVGTKSIPLTYKNNPLETPPTKQLYAGWNAIGFSDTSAAAAKDALQSVVAEWTSAIGFNAASQSYETSIINGGSGSHSDSNPMYPTKGYWLFMSADGTLASISA